MFIKKDKLVFRKRASVRRLNSKPKSLDTPYSSDMDSFELNEDFFLNSIDFMLTDLNQQSPHNSSDYTENLKRMNSIWKSHNSQITKLNNLQDLKMLNTSVIDNYLVIVYLAVKSSDYIKEYFNRNQETIPVIKKLQECIDSIDKLNLNESKYNWIKYVNKSKAIKMLDGYYEIDCAGTEYEWFIKSLNVVQKYSWNSVCYNRSCPNLIEFMHNDKFNIRYYKNFY
jgi:hypothetical protein